MQKSCIDFSCGDCCLKAQLSGLVETAFDSVDPGVSVSNGQSNCVVFRAARDTCAKPGYKQ